MTGQEHEVVSTRLAEVEHAILARTPEHQVDPSLDAITALMHLMGEPQHTFPVVHITGTNGKTSTSRMVERLLRELGLRTGRFTSPHLTDIRERIAFDGEPVSAERFVAAWDDVAPYLQMVDDDLRQNAVQLGDELVLRVGLIGWRLYPQAYLDRIVRAYWSRQCPRAA